MLSKLKKTTDTKIIVIPNFSIGAAYQKLFAASLSENFDSVNITEKHHGKKQDAPSGTAIDLANYLPSSIEFEINSLNFLVALINCFDSSSIDFAVASSFTSFDSFSKSRA
jgi:dihydrodipicolinate reductase